ncbi:hypothetical protein A2U01_0016731 [Trifolium medium]|uniref:Uncharacterized protein n=1 Tax=Trifolium medium TaxID=97028 RepID=A0A392N967_9FABA|nr:hypothetical protein [Trifolium medium]
MVLATAVVRDDDSETVKRRDGEELWLWEGGGDYIVVLFLVFDFENKLEKVIVVYVLWSGCRLLLFEGRLMGSSGEDGGLAVWKKLV